MAVEVEAWDGMPTLKEEDLPSFDAVPLCIKICTYSEPTPRNLWANMTYLKVAGTTLEGFRAQVACPLSYSSGWTCLRQPPFATRPNRTPQAHCVSNVRTAAMFGFWKGSDCVASCAASLCPHVRGGPCTVFARLCPL